MDKKDLFILIICTALAFWGGFTLHKKKYAEYPVENYSTETLDSLAVEIVTRIERMSATNNGTLVNFKIKRNEIDSTYQTVGNIQFVDDNDSLIQSVILLTTGNNSDRNPCD